MSSISLSLVNNQGELQERLLSDNPQEQQDDRISGVRNNNLGEPVPPLGAAPIDPAPTPVVVAVAPDAAVIEAQRRAVADDELLAEERPCLHNPNRCYITAFVCTLAFLIICMMIGFHQQPNPKGLF